MFSVDRGRIVCDKTGTGFNLALDCVRWKWGDDLQTRVADSHQDDDDDDFARARLNDSYNADHLIITDAANKGDRLNLKHYIIVRAVLQSCSQEPGA